MVFYQCLYTEDPQKLLRYYPNQIQLLMLLMSNQFLKNHRYWEVINLIPQNTTFISKEMIKQLEIEQELIQKKFEGLSCRFSKLY